jgi:hypothetical protein
LGPFHGRSVFFVKDAEDSLAFYTEALGFTINWNHQIEGRLVEPAVVVPTLILATVLTLRGWFGPAPFFTSFPISSITRSRLVSIHYFWCTAPCSDYALYVLIGVLPFLPIAEIARRYLTPQYAIIQHIV